MAVVAAEGGSSMEQWAGETGETVMGASVMGAAGAGDLKNWANPPKLGRWESVTFNAPTD